MNFKKKNQIRQNSVKLDSPSLATQHFLKIEALKNLFNSFDSKKFSILEADLGML